MEIGLSNTTILLTGASDGIGKAIAEQLLADGARVALHYNKQQKAVEALLAAYPHSGSASFQADLANEAATKNLWKEVVKVLGRIDAVVHNAGVFLPHRVEESSEEWMATWHRTMQINLSSVGLLTHLALQHFQERGGGRFVYIASRAAFRGETADYLAYAASKGGLVSLARSVARSFGKQHIKAFTIAPGFTRTPMAEPFIEAVGEEKIVSELALPQLTEPKDIAPLVTMLCSGLLDHATGTTIDMNGGSYMR